jgi:non-heme chloroperoxidase
MGLKWLLTMSSRSLGGWVCAAAVWLASGGAGQAADHFQFTTSDGVQLSYLEAGREHGRTVVFVPGWTMPAWIFEAQIDALDDRYHVVALDPRGQGRSEVPAYGYAAARRGRDVAELIAAACPEDVGRRVVVVGWSLGVLDTLAMLRAEGDARIAGLVLIDNSIGEPPAPVAQAGRRGVSAPVSGTERARRRAAFVAGMFANDPGADYRARLTADALRMSPVQEQALLAYGVPREAWRAALHSTDRPVLYVIRPRWRAQGEALTAARPNARVELFEQAGHALFVDEAERFNRLLLDFLPQAHWEPLV